MMSWFGRIFRSAASETDQEQEDGDIEALLASAAKAAGRGDYEMAVGMWRPLAEGGVPRAQSNLGACYADGLGVERDLYEAVDWFRRAAEAGDALGQRNLAALCFKGEGGAAQDDVAAFELYRLAAEGGDAAAQDMLSWMLLEGQGVEADPVESRRWALAAAEQEVATSMTRLGLIAHDALGMERDPEEAARWWYEAARRGEPDAQAMLGGALHLGSGVERDDRAALVWLTRADDGGSPLAATFLEAVRGALSGEEIAAAEAIARQQQGAQKSSDPEREG
ncbi:MAG TPA: tetratricopeptide repeat protein [Hansschlegelia sp.]